MIYYPRIIPFLMLFLFIGCKDAEKNKDKDVQATDLIQQSIKAHGADLLANASMHFEFRGVRYAVDRRNGVFQFARSGIADSLRFEDRLTNDAFSRFENGVELESDSLQRYQSSLNSVIYFAQLPFGLDSDAVVAENLGIEKINGSTYDKLMVTFREEGGGEDHEDVFLYWIDQQDDLIDFLAYSYCEDECGYRFRESVNRRTIEGVTLQDYINYTPVTRMDSIIGISQRFKRGELDTVSKIRTENVRIKLHKTDS